MSIQKQHLTIALVLLCALLAPIATQAAASNASPAGSVAVWDARSPQNLTANHLYAQSAILIDANTGAVLFSKNANQQMHPASITKIMTALVVLENTDLTATVTADLSRMGALEATWFPLATGEQLKVKDMLYGLLMKSYNDFAAALAVHTGGSLTGFANMMNQKAAALGCTNTNFITSHGLTTNNHYTTAADMAIIMRAAMQHATLREILNARYYTIPPTNMRATPTFISTNNKMLDGQDVAYGYQGCVAGKTGYTSAAQHTYVAFSQRGGTALISVVLGTALPASAVTTTARSGDAKWIDAAKLFDYGFAIKGVAGTAPPVNPAPTPVPSIPNNGTLGGSTLTIGGDGIPVINPSASLPSGDGIPVINATTPLPAATPAPTSGGTIVLTLSDQGILSMTTR